MLSNSAVDVFYNFTLSDSQTVHLPQDVPVRLPEVSSVAQEKAHLLAYIPWDDKHLGKVPTRYHEFFRFVLPYLGVRTTDVHTALSVSHLPELIATTAASIDEDALYVAVMLHDSGWAQLSQQEVADSLDYSALAYSSKARKPKEMHATLGAAMAEKLLDEYMGDLGLSTTQKTFVRDLVYYHDQIRPWPTKPEPVEYLLLGDADRLWSYTRENFWLDTIRKNVAPIRYVQSLERALDSFFLTDQGRAIARRLIELRKSEVALCPITSPA
jgi:hypothetical protein